MDTKHMGITFNEFRAQGRVLNNPEFQGEWARFQLMTLVPEKVGDTWGDQECIVPCMTNNPKIVQTIQNFIQAERQLYINGFLKSWTNQQGMMEAAIIINTIKLGSKSIYVPQNNQQNGTMGQQTDSMSQPTGQMGGQSQMVPF